MAARAVEHAVSVEVDVPFHDCDPLHIVWHGRYFQYLEKARTALMRSCALDMPDMRGLGYKMFIADARCRYTSPLRYGDIAKITAWFSEVSPLLKVSYTVDNLTQGRRSARAYTSIAVTDANDTLLTEVPDALRDRFPASLFR